MVANPTQPNPTQPNPTQSVAELVAVMIYDQPTPGWTEASTSTRVAVQLLDLQPHTTGAGFAINWSLSLSSNWPIGLKTTWNRSVIGTSGPNLSFSKPSSSTRWRPTRSRSSWSANLSRNRPQQGRPSWLRLTQQEHRQLPNQRQQRLNQFRKQLRKWTAKKSTSRWSGKSSSSWSPGWVWMPRSSWPWTGPWGSRRRGRRSTSSFWT